MCTPLFTPFRICVHYGVQWAIQTRSVYIDSAWLDETTFLVKTAMVTRSVQVDTTFVVVGVHMDTG